MGYPTKIATCCYCGTRAALVLDKSRHELACSSCGAPLHDMKRLPKENAAKRTSPRRETYEEPKRRRYDDYDAPYRRKPRKKRKGLLRYFIEEAFDVIEDIID